MKSAARAYRPRPLLVAAAVAAAVTALAAQAPTQVPTQPPPFRAGVDIVSLNVIVTEGGGRYVTDLAPEDFNVFEDGVKQDVSFFNKTNLPIALCLLLDTSASMEAKLPTAQEAAIGFARKLRSQDLAEVIDFDSRVVVLQGFSSNGAELEQAIRKTSAGGSTSLYNAVYIALKDLKKVVAKNTDEIRRQAIIVLSDGEDTSSLISFDEVLDSVTRSDTAVYAIGLVGREPSAVVRRSTEAEFVLRRLAQQTGGRAFFPTDAKQLAGVYGEIRAELSNQYFLAYESSNPRRDGQFRRIAVRVDRPGVVARARPGYYAGR